MRYTYLYITLIIYSNMKINNLKLKKIGSSYFILIPMDFIKNGNIDPKKVYDIDLKEVKE